MVVTMILSTYSVLVTILSFTGTRQSQTRMAIFDPLQDKNITSASITTTLTDSDVGCGIQCVRSYTCESFFYNTVAGECQLHSAVFSSSVGAIDQEGVHYYYTIKEQNHWCPEDFNLLAFGSVCIKFHFDRKNWHDANQTCESYSPHSRLVVLDNQQKNELVKAAGMDINDQFQRGVWTGLYEHIQDSYRWVDGKDVEYTNWIPEDFSKPTQQDCVYFHRSKGWEWSRESCTLKLHYVCEVDIQQYHSMVDNGD